MIIRNRQVTAENNLSKIIFDIERDGILEMIWFTIPSPYEDLVCDSYDAPLLALLIPAMEAREDIHIEGTISEKLWHNLMRSYQHIIYQLMPWTHKVNITATAFSSTDRQGSGVITGFSGGIDSYNTLHDYYYADIPDSLKLTHLLFNNVGSHGRKELAPNLFETRYQRLKKVSNSIGLPLIQVNSNVAEFYSKKLTFRLTDNIRNASVALLLQNGIGSFICSSSYTYDTLHVGKSDFLSCCDAIALPLLSTESLNCFTAGNEYTRVEKTLNVSQLPSAYDSLDVCTNGKYLGPPTNCSKCRKCNLTLLTLEINGTLDLFANSFDIEVYKKGRSSFIRKLLFNRRMLDREIVLFAQHRGYSFPPFTFYLSRIKHLILNLINHKKTNARRYDGGININPHNNHTPV